MTTKAKRPFIALGHFLSPNLSPQFNKNRPCMGDHGYVDTS